MIVLYLIEILHQTTTRSSFLRVLRRCILSKFYIKPQLRINPINTFLCCILSKFYIKPQLYVAGTMLRAGCILSKFYIKPQQPTVFFVWQICCILSKFYIKPQLRNRNVQHAGSCILSKFYIKPQLSRKRPNFCCVVSYRNSTSNHNLLLGRCRTLWLYLIEILHQTTTEPSRTERMRCCILSKFYIKPQQKHCGVRKTLRCILSKFYIKPQR